MRTLGLRAPGLFFLFMMLACGSAYSLTGRIETRAIYLPDKEDMLELRNSFLLEEKADLRDWLAFHLSGRIDGLLSSREEDKNDVLAKVDDAYLDFYFPKAEVKIGYSKVFWGKLDELAPTDIVNPLDVSKLFLEAERREAKLPVLLLMLSPYITEASYLDFIFLPFFEGSTYDELNEQSSPFNLIDFPVPVEEDVPSRSLENVEYGGRFSTTFREIDTSLYYFRGFQDFPSYRLNAVLNKIKAEYFKGDMFGFDFELVKGKWGIRGEGALLTNLGFQKEDIVDYVKGSSFTGGLGIDRGFGDNYLNLSVLYRRISVDDAIAEKKSETTLLANIKRTFSYETKAVRLAALYNAVAGSMFLKGTFSVNLLENFWADLSVGIFGGKGEDTLSEFEDSDFFLIEYKYSF